MARTSPETAYPIGDRMRDVRDLVMDRAAVVVEYLQQENGPMDRMQMSVEKVEDWLFDKTYDWVNKGRNQ